MSMLNNSSMVEELSNRFPFLLDVIASVIGKNITVERHAAPIASLYGIMMSLRSQKMSAWKKMTSIIAVMGHTEDKGITRFSHLGLMQGTTSKLRILDEAGGKTDENIVQALKESPLVKITGDNLDIRIKTGQQSTERHHKDIHYFVSNIIFCRVATPDLSVRQPIVDPASIDISLLLPHAVHKERLQYGYMILVARILSEIPAFSWMKSIVPSHIEHPYSQKMSTKSKVFQLPIQFKNEAKHEDCMDVLDEYEKLLLKYHEKANGNADLLHRLRVPVGGDQLTRVRFQEVKQLRSVSPNPQKRYADLEPIVIEMWHMKQDLLEKCYKLLYKNESIREPGTLQFFKSRLMRSDVNGKVKGAMKPHHDLLILVGQEMIREQALEFFGIDDEALAVPTKNSPPPNVEKASKDRKFKAMETMIMKLLNFYGYGEFSPVDYSPKPEVPEDPPQHVLKLMPDNSLVLEVKPATPQQPDRLFNYSLNLCHWALQVMEMDDTAHEGDITRVIPNCMINIPFFYSHSQYSKYLVECVDHILKVEHTLSPLQRLLVLEGSFVNRNGGIGNNVEADLCQEHSVGNQKELIKGLGANKTEKAISRATRAADTIAEITQKLDSALNLPHSSGKHTSASQEKDRLIVRKCLRQARPFRFTAGRGCSGFQMITRSPFEAIRLEDFRKRLEHVKMRMLGGESPDIHVIEDNSDSE